MPVQVRTDISPHLSAALDLSRSLAASYVVLHHLALARGWAEHGGPLFRLGQEAVLLFFLLSGFVIFANERRRALSPRGYYLRRLRRIYPALLAAMLVSTAVALDNGSFAHLFRWTDLAATLASLQDIRSKPGVIADPYLAHYPLWSLSYEVAFYLVFPLVLAAWRRAPQRTNMIVGVSCCASYLLFALWPNHFALVAAYFLVWWCGAMAADAYLRGGSDLRAFLLPLAWLAALCAVAAATVLAVGYSGPGNYPFLPLRHFAFALVTLVALSSPLGRRIARACLPLAAPAAACASISYGLYVLHYPLLAQWERARSLPGLAGALVLLILCAWLVDRGLGHVLPRAPRT
jgi:peptidoglycan/LPS O-acetylase OafA/YrhL